MKNILIIYTSSGHGHKKNGENIAAVLKNEHSVDLVDLFDVEKGNLAQGGTKAYLWVLKNVPWLWNFFYTNKVFLAATLPFRRPLAGLKSKKIKAILQAKHYDMVITTQVTASAVVSYLKLKGYFNGKFGVAFSDFHLHRYWLFDNVDFYLANIPEQKQDMVALGIKPESIYICGLTMPDGRVVAKSEAKIKFGLIQEDKMILVLGGGQGLGINIALLKQLAELNASIFVICGRNETLQQSLTDNFAQGKNLKIFGYIENIYDFYAAADLALTKPGGLTVVECLENYLPILVHDYIPGQEKLNYDYLLRHKLIMPCAADIKSEVTHELETGQFAQDLKQNPSVKIIVQHGETVRHAVAEQLQ